MFHVKQWGGLVYYCLIRVCDYLKHSNKFIQALFFTKGAGAVQFKTVRLLRGFQIRKLV